MVHNMKSQTASNSNLKSTWIPQVCNQLEAPEPEEGG